MALLQNTQTKENEINKTRLKFNHAYKRVGN